MTNPDKAIVIDPLLEGAGLRVAIVAARFNEFFVGHLVEACQRELRRHGVSVNDQTLVWVPGSFELPMAARELISSNNPDVVICLGCIIRGETSHYDHVAAESARGIAHAALDTGTPVIYGVVTAETVEQAINRSGAKAGNRGADAAIAAIAMSRTIQEIRELSKAKSP
ncbi:MAG: 6,7-dimethyl-8-ribityllumazine synthase [Chloroflexi bacterium]|nr:6,7-dimethyl-8-ribityllumazine synthase [Chloroflexota bacterium]MBS32820.1 6,7-dimethyl-8-ribityllumazine synthase [Verrucomicrobiales bacterium]HCU73237.1 6,7-dimethyl-8-ribityllumazine synthase [Chloroflexota bacterium]|tara:strand:- start:1940 stop:2446 length:507 start_codon:yes stop_codon:yes gene_type:complete